MEDLIYHHSSLNFLNQQRNNTIIIPDMLQNLILSDQKSEQITEYTRLNSLQQKFGNLFILISSIHVLLIYFFKNYKNVLLHSQ